MRERRTIKILRGDHLDDSLALLFFDPETADERETLDRLKGYLGTRLRLLRAEITSEQISVEVVTTRFPDESRRLVEEADLLHQNGAHRSAAALLREAINLDPLSSAAMARLGALLTDMKQPGEALRTLVRARESGGDTGELLRAMAQACLALDRRATAIAYLKGALEVRPRDFSIRRTLAKLGHPARSGTARVAGAIHNQRNALSKAPES